MSMTLPITIPSTPSAGNSPASDDSSNPPRTPRSPTSAHTLALSSSADQSAINSNAQSQTSNANPANAAVTQVKRKPSRRANTAERRATHNAVERQRRETLNGRFLDLAALLPNLSQIRRPSKSAIVNSSIAHIHASRRHRLLASRELRLIKLESDALRRELNEWRDRAGLPRVEEPVRGEGFAMVLSGEVEVLAAVIGEEDDEGGNGFDGYDDGDDDFVGAMANTVDDGEDMRNSFSQASAAMLKNANAFTHNIPSNPSGNNGNANPSGINIAHLMPRGGQHGGPMIASSPPNVSFENPAMTSLYEPHTGPQFSGASFLQQHHAMNQPDMDKAAAWNAHLYTAFTPQQLQQLQAQRSLLTPPASAQNMGPSPASGNGSNPFADPTSQAFFANFQRQQQLAALQHQHGNMSSRGHMYGSPPDRDDASSVGSGRGRRERSGSLSTGSGYGSPPHGSSGSYEMPNVLSSSGAGAPSDYGVPKRLGASGLHINTGVPWSTRGDAVDGMAGMVMKQSLNTPNSVGGGNGGGYGMMM
ncbi:hypothetical protein SERLA73DRAFT_187008 [Serpula lacrymans var. lacrymans S7.3]|uniref:BHLH domain-containing protein n=2 Tax=Serpula lacrymans var. lacrymans TaxID=341189 RepID=F8Q897_SERL3|nr:uncharacterized protein SERLADRAFT_452440 [Serpula lacrymans var. lacrymans S7.9]EGN95785.1 hypothetical protein SERLA73DRAFT_187008 [Serpula lacrymans var. lacrymans S7.3]EGO21307.1 hypothetical protein SERLADRAFT_452440 [Serpula lacrymans var. lacrymans S7.9]